jgi:formamidopyrimidine-DNA glycosylase
VPELPEVEALVRLLDERSRAKTVAACRLGSISALKTVDPPLEALEGRAITGWSRRGKYLQMATAGPGEPAGDAGGGPGGEQYGGPWLVLHLARGGWVGWWDGPRRGAVRLGSGGPLALRVELEGGSGFDVTERGTEKRLALWVVHRPADVEGLAALGPEPLGPGFDRARLGALLAGERGTLKSALARQSLVAGIGNAYSDEILHAARLSPFKPAGGLDGDELDRLYRAMRDVLGQALSRAVGLAGGELKAGKKRAMRVHGRTGESCPACGDTVREVSFADRSLQYCPTCQTGGRPLADRRLSRLLK